MKTDRWKFLKKNYTGKYIVQTYLLDWFIWGPKHKKKMDAEQLD